MKKKMARALASAGLSAGASGQPTGADGQVASEAAIRQVAAHLGVSRRKAMVALLEAGIWPRRFVRNRGILDAGAQAALLKMKVLVAGCGGLGGQVATLLVRLGAARLTLCDPDVFEESNLNRQAFCSERTLGQPKARVLKKALTAIASYATIRAQVATLDERTLPGLLAGQDMLIDCLDSVARKKMLEEAADRAQVAFLHGSVLGQDGFAFLAAPGRFRLRALYPDVAARNHTPGPNNVLAPTVAGTAALMASLLVRHLAGAAPDRLVHADFSLPAVESLGWE